LNVSPPCVLVRRTAKAIAFALVSLWLSPALWAQITVYNESFTNTTLNGGQSFTVNGSTETSTNWTAGYASTALTTYLPTLTATALGNGALSLTTAATNEATYIYNNTSFAAAGTSIYSTFQYSSYGGSGADGITFFLFDASVLIPGNGGFSKWMYTDWRGAYDLAALAKSVDLICLMTYDEHTRWTMPGPVAGWQAPPVRFGHVRFRCGDCGGARGLLLHGVVSTTGRGEANRRVDFDHGHFFGNFAVTRNIQRYITLSVPVGKDRVAAK